VALPGRSRHLLLQVTVPTIGHGTLKEVTAPSTEDTASLTKEAAPLNSTCKARYPQGSHGSLNRGHGFFNKRCGTLKQHMQGSVPSNRKYHQQDGSNKAILQTKQTATRCWTEVTRSGGSTLRRGTQSKCHNRMCVLEMFGGGSFK
jgi:hypothetical protein